MARKPRAVASRAVPAGNRPGDSLRPSPTVNARPFGTTAAPDVAYLRYEIAHVLPVYAKIRDCLLGEYQIKWHDVGITPFPLFGMAEFQASMLYAVDPIRYMPKYLPMHAPHDRSPENLERYRHYVNRAVFYAVTRHTLETFVGAIYLRAPVIELPDEMAPYLLDITGSGVSLVQFTKEVTSYTIAYGRAGILVDYPPATGPITVQDKLEGNYRPTIIAYAPWAVINWRTTWINGVQKLSLVVIAEAGLVYDDGFKETTQEQYRVLRLVDGVYQCEVWRRDTMADMELGLQGDMSVRIYQRYTPRDANGQTFDYIPFTFVGTVDNSPSVDTPPLGDIASLNIGHYRNSADFEEMLYIAGQATPVFTGLTEQWVDTVMGGSVKMGSRAGVMLPVGGSAELLQANENQLALEAMRDKAAQMKALGAKLVEEKRVQKTATEAGQEEAASQSVISQIAANVSQAVLWALNQMARFEGAVVTPDTLKFQLNTELDMIKPSPESRKQLFTEWEGGAISWTEYRHNLRRGGIATQDDEKAAAEIKANPAPMAAATLLAQSVQKNATNDKVQP